MVGELGDSAMTTAEVPQRDNFIMWTDLIADAVAAGPSADRVRGYLKATARETWQLANWLTHAKNAVPNDARLVVDATLNVIQLFTAATLRHELGIPDRCGACGSYRLHEVNQRDVDGQDGLVVLCEKCGATAELRSETAERPN